MRAVHAAPRGRTITATTHLFLAVLIGLCSGAAQAASISDRLILLQADGRSYVEQHTLVSDDQLLVVPLPVERISLETRFTGPEWLTFASAHERTPEQLSLWSGSALTRYRHRYGKGLTEPEPGIFVLDVAVEHAAVQFDDPDTVQWSLTWVLPDTARLLAFGSPDEAASGRWTRSGPLLAYQQNGGKLPELTLRFSLVPLSAASEPTDTSACRQPDAFSDACSPDVDGDEVPDYRDVCLPPDSKLVALTNPEQLATRLPVRNTQNGMDAPRAMQALGCDPENSVILSGIRFDSGQSYLNVASRLVLNRVARALQRQPARLFEIQAHTDNAGRVEHNQALSNTRARTIRHYLMLRGVTGNQIQARGLGETSPAFDNALAAGRRANRRVELRILD